MSLCARASVAAWLSLALAGCAERTTQRAPSEPAPAPEVQAPPPSDVRWLPVSFAAIAQRANPSVVAIDVFTDRAADDAVLQRPHGVGSGFFVDSQGTLLTNRHVLAGGQPDGELLPRVQVRTFDGNVHDAMVLGSDPMTDLAVLRAASAAPSPPLLLADSDAAAVGDWVVAIGNPYGLSHTVSAGILSGKGRSTEEVELPREAALDFLQTDASINPGNSGGPLLDLRGQVLGINTAIRGGGAQGIGFALPSSLLSQLLPRLRAGEAIARGALGARVRDTDQLVRSDRQRLLPADGSGVLIEWVEPDGPAARAGIAPGDVVLSADGEPLRQAARLQWLCGLAGPGKVMQLELWSGEPRQRRKIAVTLGELAPARETPPRR